MSPKMNVLTVGNAIVDIFARCEDDFLAAQGIGKSMMNLVDAARSTELYAALDVPREISGGSAANTAVGIVALGGLAGFAGRVHDDALGHGFIADIGRHPAQVQHLAALPGGFQRHLCGGSVTGPDRPGANFELFRGVLGHANTRDHLVECLGILVYCMQ